MASDLIAHVEIPSTNLENAADFYSKMFGWEFKHFGNGYLLFNTHRGFTVGLRKVDGVDKGDTTIFHVRVKDISAALNRAVEIGAHVFRGKTTIPAMGNYALINDLDGNTIGIYQSN